MGDSLLVIVLAAMMLLLLYGCSTKYVSMPCEVAKTERPQKTESMLENLRNLLIYTETIEKDLDFCRGEK